MNEFQLEHPPVYGDAEDYWPTPRWCTEALLRVHPPYYANYIIEPSAGEGAIAEVLIEHGLAVTAVEIRLECLPALSKLKCRYVIEDWLRIDGATLHTEDAPFGIIGNPPYNPASLMLAHAERCLSVNASYVALLLPMSFLNSLGRLAFHVKRPVTGLYPLANRPRFTAGGGKREIAWFVWDKQFTAQRIEVIP